VYGVVTFYAQFYLTPRGRHIVKCCRGTACHVRGATRALEAVEKELGIKDGETAPDFTYTLETIACFGTCFLAPVMMIDGSYFGKLTPQRVAEILSSHKKKPIAEMIEDRK
jgi:NADH:ubiquinone oxidoreductase subunit E